MAELYGICCYLNFTLYLYSKMESHPLLNLLCPSFQYMQEFYNRTYLDRTGVPMESSFQTLLWSLTVSMFPLGGLFGSLMVWPMVNNCGR